MAHLAIKGHKERGKEVIALLEMLGGKNEMKLSGNQDFDSYWISGNDTIYSGYVKSGSGPTILTLEQFEKEFPYKVGDKVNVCGENAASVIGMRWESDYVVYRVRLEKNDYETSKTIYELQPYAEQKEEVVPDKAKAPNLIWQQYSEGRCGYRIPEGFELDKIEDGEIILKPKKKVLSKTYKECCEVLGIDHNLYLDLNHGDISGEYKPNGYTQNAVCLFNKLYMLLICRDAYWKLAGDWKPKYGFHCKGEKYYNITAYAAGIVEGFSDDPNNYRLLIFPTPELRAAFHENFYDLINECKELL